MVQKGSIKEIEVGAIDKIVAEMPTCNLPFGQYTTYCLTTLQEWFDLQSTKGTFTIGKSQILIQVNIYLIQENTQTDMANTSDNSTETRCLEKELYMTTKMTTLRSARPGLTASSMDSLLVSAYILLITF